MENDIPKIGLGTWQNTDPEECIQSVKTALDSGYRHIDTAQIYENEQHVGKGIKQSQINRDNIFLATKVWIDKLGEDDVKNSVETSLEKLDTSFVDLLYVHWPADSYDAEETMKAFNELVEEGLVEDIGVSNFSPEQLEEAQKHSDVDILANQVEMHPFLQQERLVEYCQENDVYLVAYSPLARGNVIGHSVLKDIADNHGVSEAQVSLAWLQSKENVVVIPKASSEDHIKDNLDSVDLELSGSEIERIENIEKNERYVDPDFGKGWG